jgi:hypothetical protein
MKNNDRLLDRQGNTGTVIMLVGNKKDQRHVREVWDADVARLCQEEKLYGRIGQEEVILHAEVSAHSGEEVDDAFSLLVDATYEKFHRGNVLFGKLERDVTVEDKPPPLPKDAEQNAGCGCVLQ